MSNHWEKIIASAPANKQAAVITGKGVSYIPNKRIGKTALHQQDCPPLRDFSSVAQGALQLPDLRGMSVGRMRVVGILDRPTGQRAAWVVRCACGAYEQRSTKWLRTTSRNSTDCCAICDHTQYISTPHYRDGMRRPGGVPK